MVLVPTVTEAFNPKTFKFLRRDWDSLVGEKEFSAIVNAGTWYSIINNEHR